MSTSNSTVAAASPGSGSWSELGEGQGRQGGGNARRTPGWGHRDARRRSGPTCRSSLSPAAACAPDFGLPSAHPFSGVSSSPARWPAHPRQLAHVRTTPPVSPTSTSTAFHWLASHKFCVTRRTPRAHGSAGREWSGGATGWPETHRVTRAGSTATGAQPLSSRVEQPTPCVRGAHALPIAACCSPV